MSIDFKTIVPDGTRASSPFGDRKVPVVGASKDHKGVDIAAPLGSSVVNQADGKVVFVGNATGFGPNTVIVEHQLPDGSYAYRLYGHMSAASVKVNEAIPAGAELGKVGNEGIGSGPHLHMEERSYKEGRQLPSNAIKTGYFGPGSEVYDPLNNSRLPVPSSTPSDPNYSHEGLNYVNGTTASQQGESTSAGYTDPMGTDDGASIMTAASGSTTDASQSSGATSNAPSSPSSSANNTIPQASYSNEGRNYPSAAGDAIDSELPDGTRMVSTSSTVGSQTTVTTELRNADGTVLLKAGPGQIMERNPDTGVVSVRAEGSDEVKQYNPATRSVSTATVDAPTSSQTQQEQTSPASQTQSDTSDMLDALKDAFSNADQSAAALKEKYGPGVQVADASNSLPQDSASNQAPAQAETAQGAIKPEASEATEAIKAESASGTTLNIGAATAYAQSMLSAVNLLQALESGNTLSAALNAAGLANTLGHTFGSGPVVSQELTGGLTALSSALNLLDNLQHGNTLGALSSSLGAGSWVANAMAEHYTSVALEAITEGSVNLAAESAALQLGAAGNAMSGAVPFVGVALALESGNPVSMLAAAANFIPGYGPLISIGISLFGSGGGLFGGGATPPPPYGEVHFAWSGFDANGHPHTTTRTDVNVSGGAATASQIAGQLLGSLQTMVEQANARTLHDHPDTDPSQLLALNTNLLPSVFWDKDQTSLKLPNPDGVTSFFVNLAEPDAMSQVVQLLQTNGGIAPQWLVDTQSQRYAQLLSEGAGDAAIERELTAGKSGLTEQGWSQAAAIQGSAGEAADFKTQQFGSLIVHAQDAQVQLTEALKNIDADAYLERTEWVAANDALGHAQSLLVIDFNADGVIDTRDVLNLGGNRGQTDARDAQMLNANADLQRNNVQWLDANGDGVLDARDPAFAAVRLFMDINADARVQDGEAESLQRLRTGSLSSGQANLLLAANESLWSKQA